MKKEKSERSKFLTSLSEILMESGESFVFLSVDNGGNNVYLSLCADNEKYLELMLHELVSKAKKTYKENKVISI